MSGEYQQAVSDYTGQLRGLFQAERAPGEASTRSTGGAVEASVLAERAAALASASQRLGELNQGHLGSASQAEREAAEVKLLAQASAEVEVAWALLEAAESEMGVGTERGVRGSREAAAGDALDPLIEVLETPLEGGVEALPGVRTRSGEPGGSTPEDLQDAVRRSLKAISRSAGKTSSLGLDTLLSMDSTVLAQGVAIISKEAGELIEKVVQGVSAAVKKLVRLAMEGLLRAYDWVLSLVGHEAETEARQKVQEWINQLRQGHAQEGEGSDLATQLVTTLYATEQIQADVKTWLENAVVNAELVQKTSEVVQALGARYEAKARQIEGLFKAAKGANSVLLAICTKFPSAAVGLPVIAAVILGLVGYTLFTGYDHVDSGTANLLKRFQVHFPDKVEGVRETVEKALGQMPASSTNAIVPAGQPV